MALIYDEHPSSFRGDIRKINPNRAYRRHLENHFYLKFMLHNGTFQEKHHASKELEICDRKMEFWKKQPAFNEEQGQKDLDELKCNWMSGTI